MCSKLIFSPKYGQTHHRFIRFLSNTCDWKHAGVWKIHEVEGREELDSRPDHILKFHWPVLLKQFIIQQFAYVVLGLIRMHMNQNEDCHTEPNNDNTNTKSKMIRSKTFTNSHDPEVHNQKFHFRVSSHITVSKWYLLVQFKGQSNQTITINHLWLKESDSVSPAVNEWYIGEDRLMGVYRDEIHL